MKTILLLIIFLYPLTYIAQITYVDTDWIIDQTQVMVDGEMDTLELDFDQDGTKDMRISSWSNHQSGIYTVVEVLMLDAVGFGGLETTSSCGYISDCPDAGFNFDDINGYIYTSNCSSNPYDNQYVKMPFRFQGVAGTHCGFLYVRYVGTTITIEGYAWNPTPSGTCSCSSSGWLALENLEQNKSSDNFRYLNLLGQEVNQPAGLMLKVYDNGVVQTVYRTN